jgi:hypothetical protein
MRALTHSLRGGFWLVALTLFAVSCSTPSSPAPVADQPTKAPITDADVNAAQQAWCDGLLKIGTVFREHRDYTLEAKTFINNTYDFAQGRVFFRPTLAFAPQAFRTTPEGALSYFISGNTNEFPDDKEGFALKPWKTITYSNRIDDRGTNGIQIHGDIALAMGTVTLTDSDDKVTVVDKVFVFRRGSDNKLRLIVHMSALSNTPPPTPTPTPTPKKPY